MENRFRAQLGCAGRKLVLGLDISIGCSGYLSWISSLENPVLLLSQHVNLIDITPDRPRVKSPFSGATHENLLWDRTAERNSPGAGGQG